MNLRIKRVMESEHADRNSRANTPCTAFNLEAIPAFFHLLNFHNHIASLRRRKGYFSPENGIGAFFPLDLLLIGFDQRLLAWCRRVLGIGLKKFSSHIVCQLCLRLERAQSDRGIIIREILVADSSKASRNSFLKIHNFIHPTTTSTVDNSLKAVLINWPTRRFDHLSVCL